MRQFSCATVNSLTVAALFISTLSFAQSWPLEPVAVLGVKLGRPLAESTVPTCDDKAIRVTDMCARRTPGEYRVAPATYKLESHPFPYAAITVFVDETGVVAQLLARMDQKHFAEFESVLRTRFGPPTSQTSELWQSKGGVRTDSVTVAWKGANVSILAHERASQIDESAIVFSDNAANARSAAVRKSNQKDAAGKL